MADKDVAEKQRPHLPRPDRVAGVAVIKPAPPHRWPRSSSISPPDIRCRCRVRPVAGGVGAFGIYSGAEETRRSRFPSSTWPIQPRQTRYSVSTRGSSVNTNNVFHLQLSTSASIWNQRVDPVAEADVDTAYGRDVQAEEILKEACAASRPQSGTG